jgi:UDP-glucuronate decarboxylase
MSGRRHAECSAAPTSTLAKQVLQWEPKVPLEEDLRRTIAYFDDLLSASSPS